MAGKIEEFFKACSQAGKVLAAHVESHGFIHIFTHDDPDGLAAGAILAQTVKRLGGYFHIRVIDRISEAFIGEIEDLGGLYVFSEIGSGYVDLLKPLT
ncbi:TPA: DHH family phosphoesterase, partial [Candidatus Bathyarchaeota archaeon]|nr:DHH family phosphoesterase [Candidatus Bathyarchaeota archaeon]